MELVMTLPLNEIICGDCLEVMKDFPDNCVDLVLTDPPYMISSELNISRSRNNMIFGKAKDISHNFGEWDIFKNEQEYWDFTFAWIEHSIRILKDGRMFISFFDKDKINIPSYYLQDRGFKLKGYYAFIKQNPVPQARKVKFMSGWEEALLSKKSGKDFVFNYELGQHPDYKIAPICSGKERTKHPTQKPIKVIKPLIAYFSNPGDLVLDPFMGVGTTAVACKELGRDFIGIELNPEYIKIAEKRLEAVHPKLELI